MFTEQDAVIIDHATLEGIIQFVWATLLGDELAPTEPAPIEAPVCATISIGGPWTATLEVSVSTELSRRFAADLLDLPLDELESDDIDDALGELANVVGGNVKGLLDDVEGATLSLPVVSHAPSSVTGGHLTATCAFAAVGEPMTWALYERP